MENSNLVEIVGMLKSVKKGTYETQTAYLYYLSVAITLEDKSLISIRYKFSNLENRDSIYDVLYFITTQANLKKALGHKIEPNLVLVLVKGPIIQNMGEYTGVGAIRMLSELETSAVWAQTKKAIFGKNQAPNEDTFSEEDKEFILRKISEVKKEIRTKFSPTKEQLDKVDAHLEFLSNKTNSSTKYEWKKLFVSCIVSISVDLGFGVSVPETIINLFKVIFSDILQYKLLKYTTKS